MQAEIFWQASPLKTLQKMLGYAQIVTLDFC